MRNGSLRQLVAFLAEQPQASIDNIRVIGDSTTPRDLGEGWVDP